jgi:hypothetical protein
MSLQVNDASMTPLFRTATINTQIPLSSPDTQQMLVHIPHLAMFISLHQHFALNSKAKYVLVAKFTPLPPQVSWLRMSGAFLHSAIHLHIFLGTLPLLLDQYF